MTTTSTISSFAVAEPALPTPLALITGGAKRVGRAISLTLARAGFDLIVTYNTSADEADTLRAQVRSLGRECKTVRLALDDPEKVLAHAHEIARLHPRLDALVHNASTYSPTPIDEVTAEDALSHYRVNALAPLLLSRALRPCLDRSILPARGSIVAMCDIHAMGRPRKEFSAYSMSKAALAEMVRTLARELAPSIRVNGLAPGVIAWPDAGHESDEASQQAYLSRVPMARAGTPEEAAEIVRWLVMDASYITGSIIRVDGGRSLA